MIDRRIVGVIGGTGWLGGAIVRALIHTEVLRADQLMVSSRRAPVTTEPGVRWTNDNQELVNLADVVIVSVRPADFPEVRVSVNGKLAISVMAGITAARIGTQLGTDRVARALPNAAAQVARSYTPWISSSGCDQLDRATVSELFGACGQCDEVESEVQLDYLAGLSGTGPAFPALLADALRRDAISRGIDPEIARRAVTMLLIGTGRLLEERDQCPSELVQSFLNYRGVTAAAIEAMQQASFEAAVQCGLEAARKKSISMQNIF